MVECPTFVLFHVLVYTYILGTEVLIHTSFFSKIGALPHLDAQLSVQHFVYDPVPHLVNNIQILLERQNV